MRSEYLAYYAYKARVVELLSWTLLTEVQLMVK